MSKTKSKPNAEVKRPLRRKIFYFGIHLMCRMVTIMFFNFKAENRHLIPAANGGLVLSTHQSNFDPVLVGITFNRHMNFLARKTLFNNWIFAALIRNLDAIEIDRDGSGLSGLKETMLRLKRKQLVLIFPEGTRTTTGKIGKLKPGFISVARRTNVPLIPVAVVGAYEVMPKGTNWPKPRPIVVVIGPHIEPDIVSQLTDDELLVEIGKRLSACDQRGRELVGLA